MNWNRTSPLWAWCFAQLFVHTLIAQPLSASFALRFRMASSTT